MKRTKAPDYDGERLSDKDNYIKNRNLILKEYASYLEDIKKDKPDIDGVIGENNFQEYTLQACFRCILDQERCIAFNSKSPCVYIDIKEEKEVLKQMVKDAKAVLKKDYQRLYDHYSKGPKDD